MGETFILLVEDSLDDASLTGRAFRKAGLEQALVIVRDGLEAMDFLFGAGIYEGRNLNEMPQVILLDLNMPLMDGRKILQRVRGDKRTRRIPVVILTGSSEREDIERSYELGANSYICKPTDFQEFVKTVQQVAVYWLSLNIT
jgi:CheY-like chemotaxis protein